MSLDRKILKRIERENLKIKPRWFFTMKEVLFGAGTVSLSIFGSLSLALLFEVVKQQGESLTWLNVPYVLVILLVIFLLAGYWLVTKIDALYKIKFVPIVSMLFFISLSFGYLTFASGKVEKIELELEKIPIYDVIMPISKENKAPLNAVVKAESNNENMYVDDEDEKNKDDIKEDSKSVDSDENDKVDIRESNVKVEIREDDSDEIKKSEKTDSINEDEDEDEDDTSKGEVKGVSKEINRDEDENEEIEEIEEEKSDSDDEISEDNSEESETDSPDVVDED